MFLKRIESTYKFKRRVNRVRKTEGDRWSNNPFFLGGYVIDEMIDEEIENMSIR